MNVELTIINEKGETICDREDYDLETLKRHSAFSAEERNQMDVFYLGWDATTIFRGASQFRLTRVY
jgi:hypothetical protein